MLNVQQKLHQKHGKMSEASYLADKIKKSHTGSPLDLEKEIEVRNQICNSWFLVYHGE
jgi:hypothetical protein